MDNHPLSRSTRQTRSALTAVSFAGISFAFFAVDPTADIILPLIGVSLKPEVAWFFFVLSPVYLWLSFFIAVYDDYKNQSEGNFLEQHKQLKADRLKVSLDQAALEIAEGIRLDLYKHREITKSRPRKSDKLTYATISELPQHNHEQFAKFASVLAQWFLEFKLNELRSPPDDSNLTIRGHDKIALNEKLKKHGAFSIDGDKLEALYVDLQGLHAGDVLEIHNSDTSEASAADKYKSFRNRRFLFLEAGFPTVLALAAIIIGLINTFFR